jgi:nicotinate-nucleotide pyrophosphorylase (carboxylating)
MDPLAIEELARSALREDLQAGDLTTEACVPPTQQARGRAIAKTDLVVCGGEVFEATFRCLDPEARFEVVIPEGERAKVGQDIWRVSGNARALLSAERAALNLAQLAAGVATLTRHYVDALPPGSKTRITDTRKTTPGLRQLERYAVRVGGGHNHRDNLGAAVLLKENHIQAAGGIEAAVNAARSHAPHTSKIEIEVTNLAELDEALKAGADIVMLDNFDDDGVTTALRRANGRALIEVSGGITRDRVERLARLGVDVISVGALTHSAPAADISFLIDANAT